VLVDPVDAPGRRGGLDEGVEGDLLVLCHVLDARLTCDQLGLVRADVHRETLQGRGVREAQRPAVLAGQVDRDAFGVLRSGVLLEDDDVAVHDGRRLVGVPDLAGRDGRRLVG